MEDRDETCVRRSMKRQLGRVCDVRAQDLEAFWRRAKEGHDRPTMPNASNEELGSEVSGSESLETEVIDPSPYLIRNEGDGRCWSFLEFRG